MYTGKPTARMERRRGELVLVDDVAVGLARAVERHNAELNCRQTLEAQADRVKHFVKRMNERGESGRDVVIVLICVDDPKGKILSDALMPGADWNAIRERGEVPYARGLAAREWVADIVMAVDPAVGALLRQIIEAVVVVDHGIVQAYSVAEVGT